MAEWEDDGFFFGFSGCVPAVSSSVTVVLVVPVSPSSVCGFGEKILSDTDCSLLYRRPFLSLSLSKKSVTRFLLKVTQEKDS